MNIIKIIFHKCILLERSCKGVTGMILKCKDCGRRYKIEWEDYEKMHQDVTLTTKHRRVDEEYKNNN